jgi:hypothetical protein
MDGDRMRRLSSLDFPDVVRAIGTSPGGAAGPESSAGIHLQGGSTNHTQLLIDGIPLYNAVHAGDHPSAIDPEAVAEITSYTEPRASSGGRLSGVVEVDTRTALADSDHVAMSIWPTGIRSLAQFQLDGGSVLIGARRNYARPWGGNEREPVTLRPSDVFATATAPFATGSLTGMFFSSADAIRFDATPSDVQQSASLGNRFDWTSNARGLTWHRDASSGARSVDARVWQSGTAVGANWLPVTGNPQRMSNRFTQTAATAVTSWAGAETQTSLGMAVEELRGSYSVAGSSKADAAPLPGISSHLHVASAFIEHALALGRFEAALGGRVTLVGNNQLLLEPRAAFALPLFKHASVSAAFARTHEYTQSLYNDESIVDAMASLEVPVIAGTAGLPIASSTSASLKLEVPIGGSTLLTASTFARNFEALVLAGTSAGDPFASRGFTAGHGDAYGGTIGMRAQLVRLALEGLYSISIVSREWAGEREYRPAFAPTNALSASASYQLADNTLFRVSGFLSAIRSTSPVFGAVGWNWPDVLATQREVSGSPQYAPSALGIGQLEPYFRVDVGIRHSLIFREPFRVRAAVFANVDNLLDRRNAAGLIENPSGAGTRPLGMLPRALSFGLDLRF